MKTGQIYIIRNKVNDKVYIGQTTTNYKTRFMQHCKPSVTKTRHYKLYNAIKKYGKENFYIELLEENIPLIELDKKEIEYIEKYNSCKQGYNATKGGDGRTINKNYDENNIIKLYNAGISTTKIGKLYNVCGTTITRALEKLGIKRRADGNKYQQFDKEKFVNLWNNKLFTIKQMAKEFNVNEKTIRRTAKRFGLLNKRSVTTIESVSNKIRE